MGLTYFGRHKAMLYVGRIMTGLVNGALIPTSQIYVSIKRHDGKLTKRTHMYLYILAD